MMRLIRLVFLLMLAFGAGIFYERGQAQERCALRGGLLTQGLCIEVN